MRERALKKQRGSTTSRNLVEISFYIFVQQIAIRGVSSELPLG